RLPVRIPALSHDAQQVGVLALLVAYPKVGKSTLAAQWAVAVSQGQEFLGRQTRAGGVLLVVAEGATDDGLRRLRQVGMEDDDPIWLWTETVTDTLDDRKKMATFIRDNKIALVIIDTFASFLMVNDETNNSEVTKRLKPYVDMAHETGAAVIFVHHERKNDEGIADTKAIRGGGAILGLADVAFQLQQVPGGGTRRR